MFTGTCVVCGRLTDRFRFVDSTDADGTINGHAEYYCGCDTPAPSLFGDYVRWIRIEHRVSMRDTALDVGESVVWWSDRERSSVASYDDAARMILTVERCCSVQLSTEWESKWKQDHGVLGELVPDPLQTFGVGG